MELKRIEDYYNKIQERYPDLPIETIDKVLKFGLRSFYINNCYGADTLNKSKYFTMYCGKMFKTNLKFWKYWLLKHRIKLRIKYKRDKTQFDGYYYFGMNDEMFEYYMSQMKKSGRRRRKFHFKKLKFYKILDEVKLDNRHKHIFRIPYPEFVGFSFYKEDFITRDFDYILRRNNDNILEPVSYEERNK